MEFEFVRNENLLQSLRSFTTMGGIKNNELPLNPDNTVTLPKEYVSSTKDTPLENYAACKTPKKDISDVPFKFDDTVTLQKECIPYSSTKTTPLKKHVACKTLEKDNELPLNPDNTVTLPKEYVSSTKDTPLENYAACKTPKKDISDVPFKFDDTVTLQKECIPYSSTKTTPLKKHVACKTLEKDNELPLNPDNTVTLPKEYVSSTKDTPLENYAACKTPKKDISDVPFKFDDTVTLQKECIPYSSTKTTPLKKHVACKTLEKDVLYRKVKAIIRTIMPETFQACVLKMKGLPINTIDELKGVVILIYEKAISKDTNRIVFANLCRCLSLIKVNDELDNNKMVNFRAILLTRLQREFENICLTSKTKRLAVENRKTDMKKLQHVVEAEKNEIPAAWKEIIEFLGEIFKLKMMTENTVHDCIFRLISNMESFHLECACVLLESVGKELDTKAKRRMDQYFVNLKRCSEDSRLSPTTKANILDLTALRLNNWEAPGQSA